LTKVQYKEKSQISETVKPMSSRPLMAQQQRGIWH